MNRRATLATLLGKSSRTQQATAVRPPVGAGLDPYAGPWGFEQAAHLLRRTIFSPTYAQMKTVADMGLPATIDQLLADQPMPDPPLNHNFAGDPYVPIGETWIDAAYQIGFGNKFYRFQSLYAWTAGNLLQEGISLREKMTLFWHNHFVTAEINDPKYTYRYITLLRSQALGNFRQLAKDVTIDPAMLRYLNGNENTKVAPNENYARELLELFTIGKGELAGPGDYTTFTEDDVVAIAKVLTGWRDIGFNTIEPGAAIDSIFVPNRHDTSTKQLSHRFDNVQIADAGADEYKNLIDIIFQQDEVARFLARKLYRWFVYYEIDELTELNVIEPLAQVLLDHDFDVKPALAALLQSEHFFDPLNYGVMIKNPVDFLTSLLKPFEVAFPSELAPQYQAWLTVAQVLAPLQMEVYNPPSVAGWKAYYQEPTYYRQWINSVTLPVRMGASDAMTLLGFQIGDFHVEIDVLEFVGTIDNPSDPNAVIEEFAAILFPQPITESQHDYLKGILIPGLPDFEWTVEYGEYIANPTNSVLAAAIELKLRTLLKTMLSMPEFHLS